MYVASMQTPDLAKPCLSLWNPQTSLSLISPHEQLALQVIRGANRKSWLQHVNRGEGIIATSGREV